MCIETEPASLRLPLDAQAAERARRFVKERACCTHCSRTALADAELLVSEIVTNAVVHGDPPIWVAQECSARTVGIRVGDSSSVRPEPRVAAETEIGGRGLMLVDAIADAWGTDVTDGGKTVWFRLCCQ